ncbi:hypothetical protein NU195Hw_g3360t1 [Hortaea werneckii]
MKKSSRKIAGGSDAQQKPKSAIAKTTQTDKRQRAQNVVASRRVRKTNGGTQVRGEMKAENAANQKAGHFTHEADHKSQRQERLDRRRQSIIDAEEHMPPSKRPRKETKTSSASPTDQSTTPWNSPKAEPKQEDPNPTSRASPPLNPGTKRSSLDRLIETAPEAHKVGYRAMKYSNRLVDSTYTIQSENPGASVFDGVVEHLDTVQNELEWVMEQSRRNYNAEVGAGGILPSDEGEKRRKMVAIEDDSDALVKTRARKRIRK